MVAYRKKLALFTLVSIRSKSVITASIPARPIRLVADIMTNERGILAELVRNAPTRFLIDIGQDDLHALAGQHPHFRSALYTGAIGDDRDLAADANDLEAAR